MFEFMNDLLRAGRHSRYFNHTRSYNLFSRVRTIAWILVVLQTAWIAVDWLLLPEGISSTIAYGRITASAFCLVLALWFSHPYKIEASLIRLLLLVLVLTVFQTWSNWVLIHAGFESELAGYAFFPFMIITMLAIFPLTIMEVVGFASFIILVELVSQLWNGKFGLVSGLNDLWLLALLGSIAGWASVNQLSMLLVMHRQATRDPLTGLANRRQVMEQLDGDISESRENGQPLSVLLFDLDKFKSFNDNHGHAAGDLVLKQFARILKENAKRKVDLAGRFGGEEFLMVLPGMGEAEASQVADAVCNGCHKTRLKVPTGEHVSFSTSIGIAILGDQDEDRTRLLQRADEALYAAKDGGRDRYVVAPADGATVQAVD